MDRDVPDPLAGLLRGGSGAAPLRALLDGLPDGIVVVDGSGRILVASAAMEALSGYAPSELEGLDIEVLVPDGRRAAHHRHRQGYQRAPRSRPMGADLEIDLQRRDGGTIPVDISLSPLQVGGQALVVAAVRDATARRRSEALLRAALEREQEVTRHLRDLDAMKDTFVQALSHDLHSPLATALGMATTLQERATELPPGTVAELANRLAGGLRRLERLLDDLLDAERLTGGTVEPRRSATDIAAMLRRVVAAEAPNGRMRVEADRVVGTVDPAQVERIVSNLVSNALLHTPPATPVRVRAERRDRAVLLTVDDRGPGVPDELKEAIFEPFVQGSTNEPGSGIGLSLVARFAALHGGRAWVEDRPGGGASFRVLLPDEPAAGARDAPDGEAVTRR